MIQESQFISAYFRKIRKTELLSPEEEIKLAAKIKKGCARSREQMITANLRLVAKIAADFRNMGLPYEDLISEGNIGLMKSVKSFDPSKGAKLSTWAAFKIRGHIMRALSNQSRTVRVSVRLQERIRKINKISAKLSREFGREPSNEEVAKELEIPVDRLERYKSLFRTTVSLDAPINEDGDTIEGIVPDENSLNPYEQICNKDAANNLFELIKNLNPRDRDIIRSRFGFGGEALTLVQIGEKYAISGERVRQLEERALNTIKKKFNQLECATPLTKSK